MITKVNETELKLYVAIIKKQSLPANELGEWLKNYLWSYQKRLNGLTAEESKILMNHYLNKVPKKNLISNENITENKYYSDLRKILKKTKGM